MKRRRLSLLLVLGLLLGLLSGCGDKAQSAQNAGEESFGSVPASEAGEDAEAETSAAESGIAAADSTGSFSMPFNSSYGWNPYTCTSLENRAVMQLIYEGLFTMTPTFDAEPCLCSSFEVSEDGYTYTLELRDAVFSSGKTLTASDVVYSMSKAEESELYASRFDDISAYYASGSSTVTIELYYANDRLPCLLTFPIVPSGSSAEAPPGTGPFVRADSTVLAQNSQWWQGADTLNFQTVTLYSSVSAEDTRDRFEIGGVNFVYNNPSASTAASFHCDYELWNSRSTVMQYIGFNFQAGVFQDQAVRAAITHAIDRSGIAESVYHNFADAAVLPAAPSSSIYFEDLAQEYNYVSAQSAMEELLDTESFYLPEDMIAALRNPSAAQAAEAAEGNDAAEDSALEDGAEDAGETDETDETDDTAENAGDDAEETTYNNIVLIVRSGNLSRVAAAKKVAENLTAAGFTVDFQELEYSSFYSALSNGEYDLYYGEIFLKPDFDLRELLLQEGDYCYGGLWEDSQLRSLIVDAMENSGNRYDLYEYIMEEGYLCPVLFVNNAVFTTRGVFTGLNPAPDNLFYQISNIQVNHN